LIILFGDSRVANWRPKPDIKNFAVLNKGQRGITTSQLRYRLKEDLFRFQPKLVILQAGINDLKNIGLFPQNSEKIFENCIENIKFIVNSIQAEKIQIFVLTIFPTGKPGIIRSFFWSEEIDKARKEINSALKKLQGERIKILDVEKILVGEDYVRSEFQKDLLHINSLGYKKLNVFIQPYLEKALKS
jgi:lysophospholipase L1-like esterase